MKRGLLMITILAMIAPLRAASTNAPAASGPAAATSFDSFKIIAQRNIFNPNRSGRPSRASSDRSRASKRIDTIGLVGTMIYEKGKFAFFDSSSSEYRKVLSPSDNIAGYSVKDVEPGSVKLDRDGKSLELAVGQQLRREDGGDWTVSTSAQPISSSSGSSSSADSSSDAANKPSSGSAAAGSADAVLQRLLQKREEELKK